MVLTEKERSILCVAENCHENWLAKVHLQKKKRKPKQKKPTKEIEFLPVFTVSFFLKKKTRNFHSGVATNGMSQCRQRVA